MSPYHNRLKEGVEPSKAWEQSKDDIDAAARYGTWQKDFFLSKPEETGHFCHAMEIRSDLLQPKTVFACEHLHPLLLLHVLLIAVSNAHMHAYKEIMMDFTC